MWQIAWRSYKSLAVTLANTPGIFRLALIEICHKIKADMKELSSNRLDSTTRDTVKVLKQFHWDTVLMEFEKMLLILLTLLKNIMPKPSEHKLLLCLTTFQLLKSQHQRMGLVQCEISIV